MAVRVNERPGYGMTSTLFRRYGFKIILWLAMLIGSAVILVPSVLAQAQTDKGLDISVDYDRQCGDLYAQQTQRLGVSGAYADITVKSDSYWNATGLILEKGVTYAIKPTNKEATWNDASVKTTVSGWWPKDGWLSWFMMMARPLVRAPDQNLFQLVGMVYRKCADDGDECRACARQFPIGKEEYPIKVTMDGEFCSYANDLPFMYGTNSGEITIRVTRKDGKPKPGTKTPAVGAP